MCVSRVGDGCIAAACLVVLRKHLISRQILNVRDRSCAQLGCKNSLTLAPHLAFCGDQQLFRRCVFRWYLRERDDILAMPLAPAMASALHPISNGLEAGLGLMMLMLA